MPVGDKLYRGYGKAHNLVNAAGSNVTVNKQTFVQAGEIAAEDTNNVYVDLPAGGSGGGGNVNLTQVGGVAVSRNSGVADGGTLRVTLSHVASYTETAGSVGTTSALLLAANTSRRGLFIQNVSNTATIAIRFGGSAAALNTAGSIMIPPLGTLRVSAPVTQQSIQAISTAASTPVTVIEA